MAIDWANVSWIYVAVLAVFVFLSSLIGSLLSFRHHLWGSALSAVVFAAVFVFWTYYPHHVPLPTRLNAAASASQPAAAKPAGPEAAKRFEDATPKPGQPSPTGKPNQ